MVMKYTMEKSIRQSILEIDNAVTFLKSVGSLMYAQVCTHPDIAFAVIALGRYLSNPGLNHWKAMKKVMRCHAPDPGPTRLASPNRSPGRDAIYTIYILYCIGTLLDLFFLRAVPVPVGIQTISVITKIIYIHIQKNYHWSGVHKNLYTNTESLLLLLTLIHVHF